MPKKEPKKTSRIVEQWKDEEFQKYCDQVLQYEVTQLLSAGEALTRGVLLSQSRHLELRVTATGDLRNALIESFAIHSRALIWFLYPPDGMKKDDVASIDYGLSKRSRPTELDGWYRQASKQVAHTTTERLDLMSENKKWSFREITSKLTTELTMFVRAARSERIGSDFRVLVDKVEASLT
jgi:hypothetical protein